MRKLRTLTIATALATATLSTAFAQGPGPGCPPGQNLIDGICQVVGGVVGGVGSIVGGAVIRGVKGLLLRTSSSVELLLLNINNTRGSHEEIFTGVFGDDISRIWRSICRNEGIFCF